MIQSIYTSVSNADIVPCGKKGQKVSSEPIPLLRNNYLGEYRTELEKAKVRKNLGIADEQSLLWGSIEGHIEEQKDVIDYIKTMQEYTTDLNGSVTNVKEALDYVLEFVTTFKGEEEAIKDILENISNIHSNLTDLQNNLTTNSTNIGDLQSKHAKVEQDIADINEQIKKLNQDLIDINVDDKIQAWVTAKINSSSTLVLGDSLEVKISETENNAVSNKDGLFVQDLSVEVSDATKHIGELQTKVQNISDTYVTKDQLGNDGDYSFVKQEVFDAHTQKADTQFGELKGELLKTVKTGEDGHVDTLYVNKLSNQEGNIKIDKPLEVQSGVPLDIRTVVRTTEELYKIDPKVAYTGMAVANASNGYIYILMDPTRITEKSGWKASYESIQIITCTQEEYEAMAANTNDDYTYKEEGKPFLYEDTYYYIYENEEKSQYYVTAKQIEEWLKAKASAADVASLSSKFSEHIKNYESTADQLDILSQDITDNYNTAEQIAEVYATKKALQDTDSKFESYSTSEEITKTLEDYVTKDSLRGGLEGEDDFVFVTQNQYNADKEANLEKITTTQLVLTQDEIENAISVLDFDLSVNNKPLAYREEVPKIQLVETKAEFEEMEKDPNTYYYICDDETIGYLTNITAGEQFYTKLQVNNLIAQATQKLIDEYIVPLQQEIAALKDV